MLKLALALFFGLATIVPARAEPTATITMQLCDTEPGKVIDMVQDRYGELPFLQANTAIMNPRTGKWNPAEMIMFMHPEKNTFTVILIDPETGLECLFLAGDQVAPIVGGGI